MPEMQEVDYLIVGGGLAAAYCASELRKRGADGSVLLAAREPEPPYERPPLSKEYLRGESERADAYVNPTEWYAENDVELRTKTSVMAIDESLVNLDHAVREYPAFPVEPTPAMVSAYFFSGRGTLPRGSRRSRATSASRGCASGCASRCPSMRSRPSSAPTPT